MYTPYYTEMSLMEITLDIVSGIMTDAKYEYNTYFRARSSPKYLKFSTYLTVSIHYTE